MDKQKLIDAFTAGANWGDQFSAWNCGDSPSLKQIEKAATEYADEGFAHAAYNEVRKEK